MRQFEKLTRWQNKCIASIYHTHVKKMKREYFCDRHTHAQNFYTHPNFMRDSFFVADILLPRKHIVRAYFFFYARSVIILPAYIHCALIFFMPTKHAKCTKYFDMPHFEKLTRDRISVVTLKKKKFTVLTTGIEPATVGLLDQCSTDWATRADVYDDWNTADMIEAWMTDFVSLRIKYAYA